MHVVIFSQEGATRIRAVHVLNETEATLWTDPDYSILRTEARAAAKELAKTQGAHELAIVDERGVEMELWRIG